MSHQEARYYLDKTRRRVIIVRLAELIIISVSISFVILCILFLTAGPGIFAVLIATLTGLAFFLLRAFQLQIFGTSNTTVASYLNRHYPSMEEGADLILKNEEDLTSIQQLQRNRSIKQLSQLYPSIKIQGNIGRASLLLFTSLIGLLIITYFSPAGSKQQTDQDTNKLTSSGDLPVSLRSAQILVTPPAYTKLIPRNTNDFNLRVQEGSVVKWNLAFDGEVMDPGIIFSGKDTVQLRVDNGTHTLQRSCNTSSFYTIYWKTKDGSTKSSDFFQLEVIKDQSPVVTVNNLNQFTEFSLTDRLAVDVRPTLKDDYSLEDAYIIATVSKGSGESVKFRELKINFDKPRVIRGPEVNPSLTMDIVKLGLEPGDELYFYIEAVDNKVPAANKTRTETFFISLRDTSSLTTTVDAGLGVDLMPEYFRSQRQIIIDSEKLLRERKSISKETFNSRSNSLAYDQKVLRLRYGEFLGEEFESGIGPQSITEEDHADDGDVTKKYGHVHDKDNEHNLVEEKKQSKDTHDHDGEDKSDPLKEFTHSHDSQEEATFFTQSIRAKLKAAITIMWDAELHLRLYDPEKSLPYQYRALKLLKEISQDSRIYVHRTGFEPPPLKEEKRLTGDLTEIKNSTAVRDEIKTESYPNIRQALHQIEYLLASEPINLTTTMRQVFEAAGQELASVAIQQPGRYLKTLSSLKALSQNELENTMVRPALVEIRKSLWQLLPVEATAPQASFRSNHKLDDEFLKNLEQLKRE